jgi:hypothetical protein
MQEETAVEVGAVTAPLAIHLYREYLAGKTVETLAREYRLPLRSVQVRLRAATVYFSSRSAPPPEEKAKWSCCLS